MGEHWNHTIERNELVMMILNDSELPAPQHKRAHANTVFLIAVVLYGVPNGWETVIYAEYGGALGYIHCSRL